MRPDPSNLSFAALTSFCLFSSAAIAQDHIAAPMIGSQTETAQALTPYADKVAAIKANFRSQYMRVGRPRIAIFWNRKLDDQLSQWYTPSRRIDTRNHWGGGGFTATQRRVDVEGRFDRRPQPGELAGFEFGAGLTSTLINAGVEIIDRDTIMRLTQREVEPIEDGVVISDYQQIEMDALAAHADLFVEVLYVPQADADSPFTVMITIKEVRTGKVAAMFRSEKSLLPEGATQTRWVATGDGYRQEEVPVENVAAVPVADGIALGTPEHLGWNVALQTMSELSRFWDRV